MNTSHLITLADVTSMLPRRNGKKVHIKTVMRWVTKGCRGQMLEAVKIGSVWFTSETWLLDFQRRCSERSVPAASLSVAGSALHQMSSRILMERYGFHATEEALPNVSSSGKTKRSV